jgi:histidyl-tRNA synthetase
LFHLLIAETVVHWGLESSRGSLARMFEHMQMRRVSRTIAEGKQGRLKGEDLAAAMKIRQLAQEFVDLQNARHIADYESTTTWTSFEAEEEV